MNANKALNIGKLVISTNIEFVSEVITENINGVICKNVNRMVIRKVWEINKWWSDERFLIHLKEDAKLFRHDDNNSIIR